MPPAGVESCRPRVAGYFYEQLRRVEDQQNDGREREDAQGKYGCSEPQSRGQGPVLSVAPCTGGIHVCSSPKPSGAGPGSEATVSRPGWVLLPWTDGGRAQGRFYCARCQNLRVLDQHWT